MGLQEVTCYDRAIPHHPISAEGVPPLSREGSGPSLDFDALPAAFGSFRVEAALGDGRFGPVFLAVDPATHRRVVVRTFGSMPAEQGKPLLDALHDLCELPLDHPSVAQPLAAGVEGGVPYLVHGYLEGAPADEFLAGQGPQRLSALAPSLTQVAAAIDFAAAAGVHHGALTLRDVIINRDTAGVSGFGLYQALGHEVDSAADVQALANLALALADPRDHTTIRVAAAQNPATALTFAAALQQKEAAVESRPLRQPPGVPPPVDIADTPLHTAPAPDPIVAAAVADLPLSIDQGRPRPSIDLSPRDERPRETRQERPREIRQEVPMFASTIERASPPARTRSIAAAVAAALVIGLVGGFAGGYVVGSGRLAPPSIVTVPPSPAVTATGGQTYTDEGIKSPDAVTPPVATTTGDGTAAAPSESHPKTAAANKVATAESTRLAEPSAPGASSRARDAASARQAPRSARSESPRASEPSGPAALFIDSHPSGAQVFVDGGLVGRTPLLLDSVRVGHHQVRMSLPMHRSWATSVDVTPGTRTRVAASLEEIQE